MRKTSSFGLALLFCLSIFAQPAQAGILDGFWDFFGTSPTGFAAVGGSCTPRTSACGDDGNTQLWCNADGQYQFSQYCSTTDRHCEHGTCKAICGDGICGVYESYANCPGTRDCSIDSEVGYCDNDFDDDDDGFTDCYDSDCSSECVPPSISASLSHSTQLAGSEFYLTATITDDKGMSSAKWSGDHELFFANGVAIPCSGTSCSCNTNIMASLIGTHIITVEATDTDGQITTKELSITLAPCTSDAECIDQDYTETPRCENDKILQKVDLATCITRGGDDHKSCSHSKWPSKEIEDCTAEGKTCSIVSNAATCVVETDDSPVVSASLSPSSTRLAGKDVTLMASITDDKGISSARWFGSTVFKSATAITCSGTSCDYSTTISTLETGTHTITVEATDTNDQVTTQMVHLTINSCSADSDCGGELFPEESYCSDNKVSQTKLVNICVDGGCAIDTYSGHIWEDCSASGKTCTGMNGPARCIDGTEEASADPIQNETTPTPSVTDETTTTTPTGTSETISDYNPTEDYYVPPPAVSGADYIPSTTQVDYEQPTESGGSLVEHSAPSTSSGGGGSSATLPDPAKEMSYDPECSSADFSPCSSETECVGVGGVWCGAYCSVSCSDEEPEKCTDSDGGSNLNVRGTTYGLRENEYVTEKDSCDNQTLVEYFCVGNSVGIDRYKCVVGCEDGSCIPQETVIAKLLQAILDLLQSLLGGGQ